MKRLDSVLGAVPPATALKLARAIEQDRLQGGALPHDVILQSLRPRLRDAQSRLNRLPSPSRLVAAAFEDLLSDRPRLRKQRGRIARQSVSPVWYWLTHEVIPAEAEPLLDAIRAKLLSGGPQFAEAEVAAFQAAAADAILAAVPSPDPEDERSAAAARALGGMDLALDAHDMAHMMRLGRQIRRLQQELPRPIEHLGEGDIGAIRIVWEQVMATHPDSGPYIAFFIMGRLARPWEVMRLAGALSGKMDDLLISRTDLGLVGELLMADLEDDVDRLRRIRTTDYVAAPAVEAVAGFARVSTGVVRELGIKRDGAWGRRLMAARSGVAEEVERLLGRAVRDISTTLPTSRKAGFSLRAQRVPDLTRTLDRMKAARAVEVATLIAGARPHAMAGAFSGFLSDVDEEVCDLVRKYTSDMLDELRRLPEATQVRAGAFVDHATTLARILFGETEGQLLRRRVVAATQSPDSSGALVA